MTPRDLAARYAALQVLGEAVKAELDSVRASLMDALDEVGADSARAVLPDGTEVGKATLVVRRGRPVVVDETLFCGYVAANYPTEVETVTRVRPAFAEWLLTGLVGDPLADPASGEVVPGVGPGGESRYVSLRGKDTDAITAAIRGGLVNPLAVTA